MVQKSYFGLSPECRHPYRRIPQLHPFFRRAVRVVMRFSTAPLSRAARSSMASLALVKQKLDTLEVSATMSSPGGQLFGRSDGTTGSPCRDFLDLADANGWGIFFSRLCFSKAAKIFIIIEFLLDFYELLIRYNSIFILALFFIIWAFNVTIFLSPFYLYASRRCLIRKMIMESRSTSNKTLKSPTRNRYSDVESVSRFTSPLKLSPIFSILPRIRC